MMRLSLIAGLVLFGVLAQPAAACPRLPAESGSVVSVKTSWGGVKRPTRTVVSVCTGGRRVVLRRATLRAPRTARRSGVMVRAASAAGRRVAWIEARLRRGSRVIVVQVVSIHRRGTVRRLRRVVVHRDRLRQLPELGVVITRGGELAWLHSTPPHAGRVVVQRRAGRPRPVAATSGYRLLLEDRRTLRWTERDGTQGFFDLRHRACPSRSRFRPLFSTDRLAITQAVYGDEEHGAKVVRACDLATGRDLVLAQAPAAFPDMREVVVVGADRTWVLIVRSDGFRYEPCDNRWVQTIDVARGRRSAAGLLSDPVCRGPGIAAPAPGTPLAITDRGAAAWIALDADEPRLIVAARGTVRELDRAGTISDLRADGDAITWTRDGSPRRALP